MSALSREQFQNHLRTESDATGIAPLNTATAANSQ